MKLTIFSDGGARGNPGPAATGWVIKEGSEIVDQGGSYLGESTNNVAEYTALKEALEKALSYDPEEINCFLDSELLVKQLKGEYKVKAEHLKSIILSIMELIDFKNVSFDHVPRSKNKHADAIVNKILDANR